MIKLRIPALILLCFLAACSIRNEALISHTNISIGIAGFTQPHGTADLLAGYISENTPNVEEKVFIQLDEDFARMLAQTSDRHFVGYQEALACTQKTPKAPNSPAFSYWMQIGQCMNVDILVVPQIHLWQERVGSDFGAELPAAVSMDIFLLDLKNKELISRSRYDELQRPLLDNILDIDKFIERGGKWVTAKQLGQEGMYKAIKEFGL